MRENLHFPNAYRKEEKLEKNKRKDGLFQKREYRKELIVQQKLLHRGHEPWSKWLWEGWQRSRTQWIHSRLREMGAELEECLRRKKKVTMEKRKEKRDEKPWRPVISQGRCCCQETSSSAAENYSSWKLGSQEKERFSTNWHPLAAGD